MTGRPGHWSQRGEYNILFLGSILVISSQDSSALGYREFTQEGPMTISPFAAREGTSAPQWPNVKKCCRHLIPSSDFFVQSYAVPRSLPLGAQISGIQGPKGQLTSKRWFSSALHLGLVFALLCLVVWMNFTHCPYKIVVLCSGMQSLEMFGYAYMSVLAQG